MKYIREFAQSTELVDGKPAPIRIEVMEVIDDGKGGVREVSYPTSPVTEDLGGKWSEVELATYLSAREEVTILSAKPEVKK